MPITDLAFPLLIGAGILIVLSQQQKKAIVAPIDIAAAPDPVKCKAYDDAKVNSKLVGEPCSQVCGTPEVGGDQTKCADCETVCGVPNCGCFGTNKDPVCEKFGPLAEGCTNTRPGEAEDSGEDDNEDDDNDGGGGGNSTLDRLKERGQSNLKRLQEARKTNPTARYVMAYTPTNWG